MTHFRIDVVSDTVCPWCYVGRKQVQRAQQIWQQRYPSSTDTFSVKYAPFQLNPEFPRGPGKSVDKQGYFMERFGERMPMMHDRMRGIGEAVGIKFRFGGRIGNSRDSHRLIQLAKKHGDETELKVVDGLFAAYFEDERDIADHDVLKDVAVGAGIPEAEFKKAIVESDEGGEEVDMSAGTARYRGISGVPDYTIQGKFRLSGAQDAMEFVNVFERVKAQNI
ncbi:DSBA-like thioredoxin domain-containing protein [Trichoderma sp. SZMC 28012]